MRNGKESTLRLLIVDDSVEDAESVVSTLRNGGIAVRPLRPRDSDELSNLLTNQPIDVALAAQNAQGISLGEATKVIRDSGKDLPVLALLETVDEATLDSLLEHDVRLFALRRNPEHLLAAVHGEWDNLDARRGLRLLEAQLRETERRCETLIESSRDPVAYLHEGMHVRANLAYLEMFGFESFDDIEGLSLLDLVTSDHVSKLKEVLKALARGAAPPPRQSLQAQTMDGLAIPATLEFASAMYEGEPCVQVVFRKIEEEVDPELSREVEELRHKDQVTGLLNRATFQRALEDAVAQAARGEAQFGLLLVEPDQHQRMLQDLGLDAADRLVQAVAARMQTALGEYVVAARFGEYSFALLQRGAYAQTTALAEKVLQAFKDDLLSIDDWAAPATVSVGGAQIGERLANVGQALNRADSSLRGSQELGGDHLRIFDPAAVDREEQERVQHWLGRIQQALHGEGFSLLFQPAIGLQGDATPTYEALLRLDNNGELTSPDVFLSIAEENGLLADIDRWVVEHAIDQLAAAKRRGVQPRLLVKISPESFHDDRLLLLIGQRLAAQDVPGDLLWLQTSESRISTQLRAAAEFSTKVGRYGSKLGLEQFGSGVDSFRLLSHFKPSFVKIDRSLTQDLASQPDLQQKLQEITQRARSEDIVTLAGFVEEAAALGSLFGAGLDFVSGHFIAVPRPAMDFDFA